MDLKVTKDEKIAKRFFMNTADEFGTIALVFCD